MKWLLLIAISLSLFADDYTTKEKILHSILSQTNIKQNLIIWSDESTILNGLGKEYNTTNNCNNATLLIITEKEDVPQECLQKQAYIFVLDYKLLSEIPQSFGALFWKKGRANIVILEPRIKTQHIAVSEKLKPYLENKVW